MTTRSTKYQFQKKLEQIRKLQDEKKTNKEIADIMKIPLRTVVFYVKRIHDQEKAKWQEIEKESLISRALRIKRKYEDLATLCYQILHDEKKSPRDRIEAGKTMIACHLNIYNMLKDGPLQVTISYNNKI